MPSTASYGAVDGYQVEEGSEMRLWLLRRSRRYRAMEVALAWALRYMESYGDEPLGDPESPDPWDSPQVLEDARAYRAAKALVGSEA